MPKPDWIRTQIGAGKNYLKIRTVLSKNRLHTVCEEAHCPNLGECWMNNHLTFILLGNICTRHCKFCSVRTGKHGSLLDTTEPARIAQVVHELGLKYVVLTSVTRDDLPDEGANHFAETITLITHYSPHTTIECLVPDFNGRRELIENVLDARPNIFAHNIETVKRITPTVRDAKSSYIKSLTTLKTARNIIHEKDYNIYLKSSIMVGLGESNLEIHETIAELAKTGCDILTIGQYLQSSKTALKVQRYVLPEEFVELKNYAHTVGIKFVFSSPLMRSSYLPVTGNIVT